MASMRLTLAVLVLAFSVFAQDPPKPPEGARRPMPEPKNLKVLTLPAAELIPLMRTFNTALGVKCDHCHVQGNFAADDKHTKEIGRHMISMVTEINGKFPDGKAHVSCFTCHRGELEPKMAPPAAAPAPPPPAQ